MILNTTYIGLTQPTFLESLKAIDPTFILDGLYAKALGRISLYFVVFSDATCSSNLSSAGIKPYHL